MEYKVRVHNVSKVYNVTKNKKKLWNMIVPFMEKKTEYYQALRAVSFDVEPGDSVGIVGLNGSGKSTLSNLLGGVSEPSTGSIEVNGEASLIAISAGLNMELTGRENIRMKCLMHGMSEREIDEKYDDIVEFSELEDFMNQPIKNYSSGMQSRLGFSIAVHTNPDVLIVDEALSVGDDTFANKCIKRMEEFRAEGKTIFFVSHSIGQIQKMCNKALWIHYGEVREYGSCIPVVGLYARFVRGYNQKPKHIQQRYKKAMTEGQRIFEFETLKDDTKFGIGNSILLGGVTIAMAVAAYFQVIGHL
ncbi:ABC transporter ATP-binding protein [Salinicoccus halodurans]|uniref:Teichoic acid ABC transporter ATP-binding protein n=1 Tax=Salinicoccus halodurans TaxID=407035 RepID=A0A0F7HJ97_9STAP|nr:ABC transporter ATP-binding protein [Salinicoccus halodurans]AKG73403.1 teichoic acid ABC transporter ATP-binding protein [Salinicoccus halodurans]SFK81262.1 teichoic acid transport system ATP-binding protein [Salinicoccus halodurans]